MRIVFYPVLLLFFLYAAGAGATNARWFLCVQDTIRFSSPAGTEAHDRELLKFADRLSENHPEKSIRIITSVLERSSAKNQFALKGEAYRSLGNIYIQQRFYMLAWRNYMNAERNFAIGGDTSGLTLVRYQIGGININLDQKDKAMDFFFQSLYLAKLSKNYTLEGQSLVALARIFRERNQDETAELYRSLAIVKYRKVGRTDLISIINSDRGDYFIQVNQPDSALQVYRQALREMNPESRFYSSILTRIGHAYSVKGNHGMSLEYNRQALAHRLKGTKQYDINSSLINIAGDFFNLGQADSALYYLFSGLQLAQRNQNLDLMLNGYKHLYRYCEKIGNYRYALKYYDKYGEIEERIMVEKRGSSIDLLNLQNQLDQFTLTGRQLVEKEKIQELVIQNQNYPIIIALILAAAAGLIMIITNIILVINWRTRLRKQEVYQQLSKEIKERESKEQQTQISKRRFQLISENSTEFITIIDAGMNRIYASPACRQLAGYEPEELLSYSPFDLIDPGFYDYVQHGLDQMIRERKPIQMVYKAIRKDGTSFWVEASANPLFDSESGNYTGFLAVTRDIEERMNNEIKLMEGTRQKENLLKEIHHRVKNNFAILVSLINMQSSQVNNDRIRQSLTNLQLRIRAMALVHEMLYRSADLEKISLAEYLRSLAAMVSGALGRRNVTITVEAADAVINIDTAIPLGLIVNEMLSNAYTHGFPDNLPGKIRINFLKDHDSPLCSLTISDSGVGLPADFNPESWDTMGMQIIQLLTRQLEARLETENNQGAVFRLFFELPGS